MESLKTVHQNNHKEIIIEKMKQRGFTVFSTIKTKDKLKLQFVSESLYSFSEKPRDYIPAFSIIIDIDLGEFECFYNVPSSINMLKTPVCGSVLLDSHFDHIVGVFETHVKWLSKIT